MAKQEKTIDVKYVGDDFVRLNGVIRAVPEKGKVYTLTQYDWDNAFQPDWKKASKKAPVKKTAKKKEA
mgnify:CR=1 FL=1|tara:strand:+ start:86 stop:289 length:204 start_codon:yes stop_codon:yes gene_type:complete